MAKKVKKYPPAPYYPYKGSTLRVNKSYDKNHVQPSVFPNGGKLVTIGDKTYDTSSKEYKKLIESGKVKPYTTDTESGIGAFDYGNLPDFEITAPTQEAVDMAKGAFNRSPQGEAKQQDIQKFLSNQYYPETGNPAGKGMLESMVEGTIDNPNNLSYYPGVGEIYDAGHLGRSLKKGNYEDAAYDAAGFAIPFAGGAAVKKFVKPYLKNAYKYNPFATNLESKITKENLLARQIYGDEAYENFLKHGPATEYGKNVPRHKQIREWLDADVKDVVVKGKAGKNKGKLKVASTMTEDRNFKYPYFQKSKLFFSPNERALYNADMGKGRVIIPKDVNAKSFYPAGETSFIRNVDTAPKDAAKMYSGEKYILSPFDKNSFNSKAFNVYEETPHWLMGNRKIKRHGGPGLHIDPTALEAANANINISNTAANTHFTNPDNFAETQKRLNEFAVQGKYTPTTYSGGLTSTGNTVSGGYNPLVNQSNTLTGGEFYNNDKMTNLPIVSYNDLIDKKGQHLYIPNYGIKAPTAPINRGLTTETAQRPIMQNVPLQTNKRKNKIGGGNNKYMKNVSNKHFQTQAVDEQGNPMMEDYPIYKQGDKTVNERTYNTAIRKQQQEQTAYESDLLKTQELADLFKTYGGPMKKKYPNGGNDKTVPSWINKSITSRPNYVEKLPTQKELDKEKYTKDYTPTDRQQILIDKELLSYKDAYKGEGEKTKTAWNKYSDPLSREEIKRLYPGQEGIDLGLISDYKKGGVDASIHNKIKAVSPLTSNINQLAGSLVSGDARMNNESLSNEEKILLYNNIQNAVKRTGNSERGGIEYADYGNQGYGSSEQFEDWFVNNNIGGQNTKSNLTKAALSVLNPTPGSTIKALYATAKDLATPLTNSYTNPGFNLASTIGRGKYWQDEKDSDTYYYTDEYNWGKGDGGNKGNSFFQKGLDYLRDTESSNTTDMDKKKMQFKLTKTEIDKLIAERDASAQANGGYMKYPNGGPTDPPFTKEEFKTGMGSADMSLGVKPLNRSEQYQYYTGKPYKGDRTSFDKGMTTLATTGIGAGIGAGKVVSNYKNKYMPVYQQRYDSHIADMNAMGSSWADPNKQMSFDEYLDFYESSDRGWKKDKILQVGAGALAGSIPGFLSNFLVNRGLDTVRMNKNRKHREALKSTKALGEPTDKEILEFRNQQKHGGYMQYADGGTILPSNEMPEGGIPYNKPLNEQIMGLPPEAIGDAPPINPPPATAEVGASSIPNDFAFPGKFYNAENLTTWREQMTKDFTNPTTKRKYTETDPAVSDSLQTLFSNLGYSEDSGIFKDKEGKKYDNPYKEVHWSAATTSNAIMNLFNQDKKGIKKLGFNPSLRHASYITDAILAKKDPNYKYNLYNVTPLSSGKEEDISYTKLGVGDLLFKGRKDGDKVATSKWKYDDFIKHAEENPKSGYPSHTDIITDIGEDEKGSYYLITGGNVSSTFKSNKVYFDPATGKIKGDRYKGALKLREEARPQELAPMQNIPMQNIPTENMRKDILNPIEASRNSLASILPNNQFNMGGYMQYANGGQFDTGGQMGEFSGVPVTEFNNGGSHEANPNGGIPQGPGALVEEGELKLDLPNGEQFIVSPKIMYKKNDKEAAQVAQELGITEKEFKKYAGRDMVSVFKALTRKNSFNGEKREGDTIQENSIEAEIMPLVEFHTFLTERKNAEEEAKKEQAFTKDMDMMMQEHPEYMQAMMAEQQQQQGPSPEEQAMMQQQQMAQQGGAPQGPPQGMPMGRNGGAMYANGGVPMNAAPSYSDYMTPQQPMPVQGVAPMYAQGGQMQQAPQQGGQEQEIMGQVAQALQQGMAPEEVMTKLVEMGMPEEQAGGLIQGVMQQLQGGQQGQPQEQPMATGGIIPQQYKNGAGMTMAGDVMQKAAPFLNAIPVIGQIAAPVVAAGGAFAENVGRQKLSGAEGDEISYNSAWGDAGAGVADIYLPGVGSTINSTVQGAVTDKNEQRLAEEAQHLATLNPDSDEYRDLIAEKESRAKSNKTVNNYDKVTNMANTALGAAAKVNNAKVTSNVAADNAFATAGGAPEGTTTGYSGGTFSGGNDMSNYSSYAPGFTAGAGGTAVPVSAGGGNANGGYMQYMNGGRIKYENGGEDKDVNLKHLPIDYLNWSNIKNNLKQMNPNISEDELDSMTTKFMSNPELMNSYPFASENEELIDNSPNSGFSLDDFQKADVPNQSSVFDLAGPYEDVPNDEDTAESPDYKTSQQASVTMTETDDEEPFLKDNRTKKLKYENPDTVPYEERETQYLKPTLLENMLGAAPGIANIGMGLGKSDKLKLDRIDPITGKKISLDQARKDARELYAANQGSMRNSAGSSGNYMANMQASYQKHLQGLAGITEREQNANAQIANQVAAQNARIAAQNSQMGFREQDYDARTTAAKQGMIGTGIGQIADVYQGNRQNKFLAENYFPLIAPNYSDYYKYETKAGAKRKPKKTK